MSVTESQTAALVTLGASMKYRSATELGIAPATLAALARRGLVEVKARRIESSNPRSRVSSEPIERSYRVSMTGWRIVRAAAKA